MKKFFFLAVAATSVAFISCSDDDDSDSSCSCYSEYTGETTDYSVTEMLGKTCSELEDYLNEVANGLYTVECK